MAFGFTAQNYDILSNIRRLLSITFVVIDIWQLRKLSGSGNNHRIFSCFSYDFFVTISDHVEYIFSISWFTVSVTR
jgi:hypothetical protein